MADFIDLIESAYRTLNVVEVVIVWQLDLQLPVYNQCLSLLKLRVQTSFMARCTRYNIIW